MGHLHHYKTFGKITCDLSMSEALIGTLYHTVEQGQKNCVFPSMQVNSPNLF